MLLGCIDVCFGNALISADPEVVSPAKSEGLAPSTRIPKQIRSIVTGLADALCRR